MNFLIFTPLHKSLGSESESRSYERYSLRSNSNRQREIRKSLEKTNRDERETLVYSNADRQIHSTVELRETAIPRIFCCFDFHYSRLTRQREVIFHRAKFRNKQERKEGEKRERNLKEIPYPLFHFIENLIKSRCPTEAYFNEWSGNRYRMFVILARISWRKNEIWKIGPRITGDTVSFDTEHKSTA